MMNKNIKNSILFLVTISMLMFVNSCERPETDIPDEHTTVSAEIVSGWAAYGEGDYDTAVGHFTVAALRNSSEIGAYAGLGWASLQLGSYDNGLSQFSFVVNLATEKGDMAALADAYAGIALIRESQRFNADLDGEEATVMDEYLLASIEAGETALTFDSNYANADNPAFGVDDLHQLLAHNYFYRHWYGASLNHLGESSGFTYAQTNLPSETVSFGFTPILDEETRTLTLDPITIDFTDTLNFTLGVPVVSIVDYTNLLDGNGGTDLPSVNVMDGNAIILDGADDFEYGTFTETVSTIVLSYPLDGDAARDLALLKLSKGGIFELTDIQTWEDQYIDVKLPDGSSYTDTVQVKVPYDGPADIFRFADGFPAANDTTGFGDSYKFNYLRLVNENKAGIEVEVTYNYAYYRADFTVTSDFGKYLGLLSKQFN
jgi:hypothetical protein